MGNSICVSAHEHKRLMELYRGSADPAVRLRAHIILLLEAGHPWSLISTVLFCSTRTIARWKRRFQAAGVEALAGRRRGRRPVVGAWLGECIAGFVKRCTPRDFGFWRSRWCCATLVVVIATMFHLQVGRETVRRWLHRENLVWRRPRPVINRRDRRRQEILDQLRQLLADLPADEVAVFQDEVDINTNPKIGSMWMERGRQAKVPTPGDNAKRHLAGSLDWRTGDLILTEGLPNEGRNSALFIRHLDDLNHRWAGYRQIHVICDNSKAHKSQAVRNYLAEHGDRIVLHFLPKRSPNDNPIERIWWHLHEEITRNHRCKTIDELLDLVFNWLASRAPFIVERGVYEQHQAA